MTSCGRGRGGHMATVRSRAEAIPVIPAATPNASHHRGAGLGIALLSAATFGTSGTVADGLLLAGWSPGVGALARIIVGALPRTVPAILQLRGRWHVIRRQARLILAYGLIGVDG